MNLKERYNKLKENPKFKEYRKEFKENIGEIRKGKRVKLTSKPDVYSTASGFKKRLDRGIGDFGAGFKDKGGLF